MGPLYIKTDNSLLSSLIKIDDLIAFALKNNIKSLAITDNNMYGVLEFYLKCKKNNIKPIIGLEINNIVLYAIDYEGYKNLIKLSTISSKEKIDINLLRKYSDQLICIVPYFNLENYDNYKFYKYLYQGYTNLDEKKTLTGKKVYLNEVLYLEEDERSYLKYLFAINKGVSVQEITLNKHDNNLLNYMLYLDDCNEEIIELCNVELPLKQDLLPNYDCPNNLDSYSYLKKLVKEGLKKIFGDKVNKIYIDRLKYELDIINQMGFCNYFLVVWDYVNYAKRNDILTAARGSAAGSLVSYCLGITNVDPIKYNLYFERFLNPERINMPDIDIDFEYIRREDILNYCINKYGIKRVAPIITFGTLGSKQVIRDVGKTLSIDNRLIDNFTKRIDAKINLYENYPNIKNYIKDNLELKKLYKIALKLEGLKKHISIHAAGVVMAKENLDEIIPLVYHDNLYITGYSMEYLEDLGLLKMDFLALKNLTLINDVLKELNIKFDNIPLNDDKAIEIFANVDTIGIFQFESNGMVNFLKKFKVSNFDDIIAAIALFRPGPMHNLDTYIKRKKGLEKYEILEPLKPILESTYGIIIYQEQIMQIAHILANYTLAEADLLRKAMSKKKEDILLKEKDKFINQSIKNGYTKEVAIDIYNLILKFAAYGFNKAHSVSYALISYKMAYLKAHYYPTFMKHLLSMVIGSEIKTKEYINMCKNEIIILKPSINNSDMDYIVKDNKIIYPLTNIKNVGTIIAKEIITERKKGKFKDIFDFFTRCYGKVVNNKVIDALNKAGCFNEFYNQKTIDNNIDILSNYSELGGLLESSLKPELVIYQEYSKQELLNREIEVFGTYLSNHPVTNLKNKISSINLKDILNYYNKNIIALIYIEKIKKVQTKNNKDVIFITGSDETAICEFVLFPKEFYDIIIGDIYIVEGKVEKRFDKYQVVINRMKRVDYEK